LAAAEHLDLPGRLRQLGLDLCVRLLGVERRGFHGARRNKYCGCVRAVHQEGGWLPARRRHREPFSSFQGAPFLI
jgi:hypothetical protein